MACFSPESSPQQQSLLILYSCLEEAEIEEEEEEEEEEHLSAAQLMGHTAGNYGKTRPRAGGEWRGRIGRGEASESSTTQGMHSM